MASSGHFPAPGYVWQPTSEDRRETQACASGLALLDTSPDLGRCWARINHRQVCIRFARCPTSLVTTDRGRFQHGINVWGAC